MMHEAPTSNAVRPAHHGHACVHDHCCAIVDHQHAQLLDPLSLLGQSRRVIDAMARWYIRPQETRAVNEWANGAILQHRTALKSVCSVHAIGQRACCTTDQDTANGCKPHLDVEGVQEGVQDASGRSSMGASRGGCGTALAASVLVQYRGRKCDTQHGATHAYRPHPAWP